MDDLKSVQTSGGSGGTAAAALFGRDGTRKTAGMDVEESTGTMGVLRTYVWSSLLPMKTMSGRLALPFFLVNILQSLGVAFSNYHPVDWDNGYTTWLRSVIDTVLFQSALFGSVSWFYGMWSVIITFIGLFSLAAFAKTASSGVSRDWSGDHQSAARADSVVEEMMSCWTGEDVVYPLLGIVGLFVLVVIVALFQLLMPERIAYDTATLSMAHGRIVALESTLYMVIIFANTALVSVMSLYDHVRWIRNIGALLASTLMCWLYIVYQPYYSVVVQSAKVGVSAFLAWTCVSIVILEAVPGSGYEAVIMIYVSGTFAILTAIWLATQRRHRVLAKSEDDVASEYEAELRVRIYLQKHQSFWTQYSTVMSGAKPDGITDVYRWANMAFMQGLKRFPTSSYLYSAYMVFLFGECNFNYALTVFSKAKRSARVDADVGFHVFKMTRTIEHIFSQQKGTLEVLQYFRFLDLSRTTDVAQSQFTTKKIAFLTELRRTSPNLRRMQVIGRDFQFLLGEIQRNYNEMFVLNSDPKVVRRYASFVSNILGSPVMTKAIVELADMLDTEGESAKESVHKATGLETQAALFDEKNAVFVISGDENNLGEIFEVNLGGVDMFGFTTTSEIIGTNISSMMPTPFAEMHNGFLRKYLETGFTSVLDMTRTVIARHKMGYIFEVRLYVRQIVNHKGEITFIGVMGHKENQPELIILDAEGYLCAVSQNCIDAFQSGSDSDLTEDNFMRLIRSTHISKWIPRWDALRNKFQSESGHVIPCRGQHMHVKLKDLSMFNIGNFFFLEIWMNVAAHGSHNSLNSRLTASRESIAAVRQLGKESAAVSTDNVEADELYPSPRDEPRLVAIDSPVALRVAATNRGGGTGMLGNSSGSLRSSIPSIQAPPATTTQTGDSASRTSDSVTRRRQLMELMGKSDEDDNGAENSDAILRNTAVNQAAKYDELMRAYVKRFSSRNRSNSEALLFWLKLLGLVFLVWIIVGNVLLNGIFSALSSDIDDLKNDGRRNMEALRLVNAARSLQLLGACDSGSGGYQSDLCTLITADPPTFPFTSYSVSDLQLVMQRAGEHFSGAKDSLLTNMIYKKVDPVFFDAMIQILDDPTLDTVQLRGQIDTYERKLSILDALEYFSVYVDYIWRYEWTSGPVENVAAVYFASNEQTLDGDNKFFANEYPILPRAMTFVLENGFSIQESLDRTNQAYQAYFNVALESAIQSFYILSIVPVAFLFIGVALYIIPSMRVLVDWQADILSTFLGIPRAILQWWYVSLVRKLEEDAKDDDEGVTAELYMFLQQGELGEQAATGKIQNAPGVVDERQSSVMRRLSKKGGTAQAGNNAAAAADRRPVVTFRAALGSMKQRRAMHSLIFYSLMVIVIPLISLVLLPSVIGSRAVGAQMEWTNMLVIQAQKVHYNLREAAFELYSDGVDASVVASLEKAADGVAALKESHRHIIYGEPDGNIPGLGANAYFHDIFYGDACNILTADVVELYVLPVTCAEFDTGLLTFGLNDALLRFEQRATDLVNALDPDSLSPLTATAAAERIEYLEVLMYQITTVVKVSRLELFNIVTDAIVLNSTVLEPIQLVLALFGTVLVYMHVYRPFMRMLQEDTSTMHAMLMLFWSFSDVNEGLPVAGKQVDSNDTPGSASKTSTLPRNASGVPIGSAMKSAVMEDGRGPSARTDAQPPSAKFDLKPVRIVYDMVQDDEDGEEEEEQKKDDDAEEKKKDDDAEEKKKDDDEQEQKKDDDADSVDTGGRSRAKQQQTAGLGDVVLDLGAVMGGDEENRVPVTRATATRVAAVDKNDGADDFADARDV